MDIEFDPAKDAANLDRHGISLGRAVDFGFAAATYRVDDRRDYGERRSVATGLLDGRVHVLVFTLRGLTVRAISLRKANRREQRRHDQA